MHKHVHTKQTLSNLLLLRFGIHATKQGLLQAVNYRDRAQHDDNCANNVQNRRYGGRYLTLIAMTNDDGALQGSVDVVDEERARACGYAVCRRRLLCAQRTVATN